MEFIEDTLEVLAFKKFQEKAFLQKSYIEYLCTEEDPLARSPGIFLPPFSKTWDHAQIRTIQQWGCMG